MDTLRGCRCASDRARRALDTALAVWWGAILWKPRRKSANAIEAIRLQQDGPSGDAALGHLRASRNALMFCCIARSLAMLMRWAPIGESENDALPLVEIG